MPPPNGRPVQPPPAPQPPRLFMNTDGSGSRFYYNDSNTTINYFDITTRRYGTFMPPIYDKQTYLCTDGTSFTFFPDGTGLYSSVRGTVMIEAGRFPWMPPPPVVVTVPATPIVQTPVMRPRVPVRDREEEEESDEDDVHRRWKLGLA